MKRNRIKNKISLRTFIESGLFAALLGFGVSGSLVWAGEAQVVPAAPQYQSPFNDFVASVVGQVIIDFSLILLLFGLAFVVLNLGLLSKREEDRVGGRSPSDLNVLKSVVWPEEPEDHAVFPAEEATEVPAEPEEIKRRAA